MLPKTLVTAAILLSPGQLLRSQSRRGAKGAAVVGAGLAVEVGVAKAVAVSIAVVVAAAAAAVAAGTNKIRPEREQQNVQMPTHPNRTWPS